MSEHIVITEDNKFRATLALNSINESSAFSIIETIKHLSGSGRDLTVMSSQAIPEEELTKRIRDISLMFLRIGELADTALKISHAKKQISSL